MLTRPDERLQDRTGKPSRSGSDRAQSSWLFLLVLCAYLLLTNGYLQTYDVEHTFSASRSLVADGSFTVTTPVIPGGGAARGADGRAYAPHGIGMVVLYLPVTVLDEVVDRQVRPWLVPFLASFLSAVAGAIGVLAYLWLMRVLGVARGPALAATLLFAFASIHFVYSHLSFDVVPTSTVLLLGLLAMTRWAREPSAPIGWLLASGSAFGFSVLIRLDSVLVVAAAGVGLLAWALRRGGPACAVLAAAVWAAPLVAALAVTGWYNRLRFGSYLDDGHALDPQTKLDTPLLEGLIGQLASPGKSIFLYTPLLVLAVLGARALYRREPVLAAVVALATVLSLLFHAKLVNWSGDLAWGPRLLVPIVGMMLLPLGPWLEQWRPWRRPARGGVVLVVAVSAAVQVLGIGMYVNKVMDSNPGYARKPEAHAVLASTPLRYHAVALARAATGRAPYLTVSTGGTYPDPPVPFDIWPLNRQHLGLPPSVLLGVPLLLVGGLAGALGLVRTTRRTQVDAAVPAAPREAGPAQARAS